MTVFEIAKLTDFFLLELSIVNCNQKEHLDSAVHIQRFFGLKPGGMTCVVAVNE